MILPLFNRRGKELGASPSSLGLIGKRTYEVICKIDVYFSHCYWTSSICTFRILLNNIVTFVNMLYIGVCRDSFVYFNA